MIEPINIEFQIKYAGEAEDLGELLGHRGRRELEDTFLDTLEQLRQHDKSQFLRIAADRSGFGTRELPNDKVARSLGRRSKATPTHVRNGKASLGQVNHDWGQRKEDKRTGGEAAAQSLASRPDFAGRLR